MEQDKYSLLQKNFLKNPKMLPVGKKFNIGFLPFYLIFFATGLILGTVLVSRFVKTIPVQEVKIQEIAPTDDKVTCDPRVACCKEIIISKNNPMCKFFGMSLELGNPYVSDMKNVTLPTEIYFKGMASDDDSSDVLVDIKSLRLDWDDTTQDYILEFNATSQFTGSVLASHYYKPEKTTYTPTLLFTDFDGNVSNTCQVAFTTAVVQTHLECVNGACQQVPGDGDNVCVSGGDQECYYFSCGPKDICIANPITGDPANFPNEDGCYVSGGICNVPQVHLECVDQTCSKVTGPGQDTCSTDSDCLTEPGYCTNVEMEFDPPGDTHYIGDDVIITSIGYSPDANGVTKFKFKLIDGSSTIEIFCGENQTPGALCSNITRPASNGTQRVSLTYTLQNAGTFKATSAVCDINGCSAYWKP